MLSRDLLCYATMSATFLLASQSSGIGAEEEDGRSVRPVRNLDGLKDGVRALTISPDRNLVAGLGHDGRILIWELASGKRVREVSAIKQPLFVEFSPNGDVFAVGGSPDVSIFDTKTGKELRKIEGSLPVHVAFSPDGCFLAYVTRMGSSPGKEIRIHDLREGKDAQSLKKHTHRIRALAWSQDGRFILSGAGEDGLCLWDAKTGTELRRMTTSRAAFPRVILSPDGQRAVSIDYAYAHLWNTETGKEITLEFPGERHVRSSEHAVLSMNGKRLILGNDKYFFVFDADTGKLLQQEPHDEGELTAMIGSSDGRHFVTGNRESAVCLWALEMPEDPKELQKRIAEIEAAAEKLREAGKEAEAKKLLDEAAKLKEKIKVRGPTDLGRQELPEEE